MNVQQLQAVLATEFPKVWVRDGAEFDSRHAGSLWTGEGSEVIKAFTTLPDESPIDIPAFDYYGSEPLYVMGVERSLAEFLQKQGYYVEFYDAGTAFIYPI